MAAYGVSWGVCALVYLCVCVCAQLDAMGFVWRYSDVAWERMYHALQIFKDIHGHTLVPQTFVVPSTNPWPPHTHGSKVSVRENACMSS